MAVQPAPAVGRVALLLRAIAREPHSGRTLAELARDTGVRKPTAHSILLALAEEGFVLRAGPEPTYRLGPTLADLGSVARRALTVTAVVEPELEQLRDDLHLSAMAARVDGDEVVVLAAHSVANPFGLVVAEGSRIPLRAPMGTVYVAWAAPIIQRRWRDRAEPPLSKQRDASIRGDLDAVRDRGWSATIREGTGAYDVREARDADLRRPELSAIGISAPVWGPGAVLECSLAVAGFHGPLDGERLRELAALVVAAADRATAAMGGTAPSS